ncbi:MAG: hypothetical protein ABIQ52_18500 [Vicinamibacterales bacterium]
MRLRRAERVLLRAEIALDAGYPEDVVTCLEEVRRLAPSLPALHRLEQKLRTAPMPPFAPDALTFAPLEAPGEEEIPGPAVLLSSNAPTRNRLRLLVPAAAILLVAGVATRLGGNHRADSPGAIDVAALASPAPPPLPAQTNEPDRNSLSLPATPALAPEARTTPVPVATTLTKPPAAAMSAAAMPPLSNDPTARSAAPTSTADAGAVPALRLADTSEAPRLVRAPFAAAPIAGLPEPLARATDTAAAPRESSTPAEPSDEPLVRSALDRYAQAYSALDADAAQRVWPRVDRTALSRAFETLASQQVSLGDCAVDVTGATARATCSGSATWAPRVGSGSARTDARRWSFDLAKSGEGWQIVNARVQNR